MLPELRGQRKQVRVGRSVLVLLCLAALMLWVKKPRQTGSEIVGGQATREYDGGAMAGGVDTGRGIEWEVEEDTWVPDLERSSGRGTIPLIPHAEDEALTVGAVDIPPEFSYAAMRWPPGYLGTNEGAEEISVQLFSYICQRSVTYFDLEFVIRPITAEWDVTTATGQEPLQRGPIIGSAVILGGTEETLQTQWFEIKLRPALEGVEIAETYGFTVEMAEASPGSATCTIASAETDKRPRLVDNDSAGQGPRYLPLASG